MIRALLLCLLPLSAVAQDATMLSTADASRGWEGVGRLDVEGKGFCTGALIAPDQVLTAAHCVHDADGAEIAPERIAFLAGLRAGRAEAVRGVAALVSHPDYIHGRPTGETGQVAHDLALLQLDQPIRTTRIAPFDTGALPQRGAEVGVVSYAYDRAESPQLQEVCEVLGRQRGVLVMTCDVDFGSSGAPVFTLEGGYARIVSVVSGKAELDAQRVALGTSLEAPLSLLRDRIAELPALRGDGSQLFLRAGERNDGTGALFVRP